MRTIKQWFELVEDEALRGQLIKWAERRNKIDGEYETWEDACYHNVSMKLYTIANPPKLLPHD